MGTPVEVRPMDEHNAALVRNAHPADWVNPEPARRYNIVVIGAGTAGLVTAAGAAGLGARVALVEKNLLGGDCLNVGCVPSKAIIRSSRAVADARDGARYGVRGGEGAEADFGAVMERMRKIRSRISVHDSAARFAGMGVHVFLGEARFTGNGTVEVGGKELRYARAAITTGARAVEPDVPGLAEAGYLTNETVFSLVERPRRLAVIGAGPLGCELAQAFARLGSAVTIIEKGARVLPREDSDAARIVEAAFRRDGITLRFGAAIKRVARSGAEKVLTIVADGKEEAITVDEILVGAGRAPNVEGLGLERVGVTYNTREGVIVDDYLRTANKSIYAAGDVCLKFKFTHTADATARIVIQNALFWGRKKLSALTVPWCTYTDPEVAHVGLYEKEAEERGIAVDTFTRQLSDVDRAMTDGEEEGFVRIHAVRGKGRIVGATIVARHAGEMISEVTLAIAAGVGMKTIAEVIHPYPTQAEGIKQAADAFNRTRLTRGVRWTSRAAMWARR